MSDRHLFEHLKRQDAGIASNHLGLQTGFLRNTVDGSEIRHQLIFGEYPSLFVGYFYIPGGWEWDFWTINRMKKLGVNFFGCTFVSTEMKRQKALYGIFTLHPGTPNNQFFYACFNWMIPNHYVKKMLGNHQTSIQKVVVWGTRIMLTDICNITYLEPQTTIYQWMFGETTIFYIKIWNHPSETTIYRWLFGVPGINITIICSFVPFCFQVYFGGRGRTGCFRDLHALDTSSHTWCRWAWESWRGTRRWYRDN